MRGSVGGGGGGARRVTTRWRDAAAPVDPIACRVIGLEAAITQDVVHSGGGSGGRRRWIQVGWQICGGWWIQAGPDPGWWGSGSTRGSYGVGWWGQIRGDGGSRGGRSTFLVGWIPT